MVDRPVRGMPPRSGNENTASVRAMRPLLSTNTDYYKTISYKPRSLRHSSLERIREYETRDLFASQAARTGVSKERVQQSARERLYLPRGTKPMVHKDFPKEGGLREMFEMPLRVRRARPSSASLQDHAQLRRLLASALAQRADDVEVPGEVDVLQSTKALSDMKELQKIWLTNRRREAATVRLQAQTRRLLEEWDEQVTAKGAEVTRRAESAFYRRRDSMRRHREKELARSGSALPHEKEGEPLLLRDSDHEDHFHKEAWSTADRIEDGEALSKLDLHSGRKDWERDTEVTESPNAARSASALNVIRNSSRGFVMSAAKHSFSPLRARKAEAAVRAPSAPSSRAHSALRYTTGDPYGRLKEAPLSQRARSSAQFGRHHAVQSQQRMEAERLHTSLARRGVYLSKGSLERRMVAPRVELSAEEQLLFPDPLTNVLKNPFGEVEKKGRTRRSRRKILLFEKNSDVAPSFEKREYIRNSVMASCVKEGRSVQFWVHVVAICTIAVCLGSLGEDTRQVLHHRLESVVNLKGWNPSTATFGDNCSYYDTVCKDDTKFPLSHCKEYITCGRNSPPDITQWFQQGNCTCEEGYFGTDCSIMKPPVDNQTDKCIKEGGVWDGSFINPNQTLKHLECFVREQDEGILSLREHRVNLTISWKNTSIILDMMSRHRNSSISDPYNPLYHLCYPTAHDLKCELSECAISDAKIDSETVTCNVVKCTSCGNDNPTTCSSFVGGLAKAAKPPITMGVSEINPAKGTSKLSFHPIPTFPIQMDCYTGSCASSVVPRHGASTYTRDIVIASSVTAAVLVFVVMVAVALRLALVKAHDPATVDSKRELEELLVGFRKQQPEFGLSCYDVGYAVPLNRVWTRVLNSVTMTVHPREMVAILGSSGAGKSSLLNIIADRVASNRVFGRARVVCSTLRALRRDVICYVPQDDCLMETQTVRETLLFAARARLPSFWSNAVVGAKVDEVLEDLGLANIADSHIGSPHSGGISGGERKRLSIGMELVTEPRVLVLDEPTSGLDSETCLRVIKVLRKIAHRGCVVLATIHQPPAKVFRLFDSVLLMATFGHQVYFGPVRDAVQFVETSCNVRPRELGENDAEYLIEVSSNADPDVSRRQSMRFFASSVGRHLRQKAGIHAEHPDNEFTPRVHSAPATPRIFHTPREEGESKMEEPPAPLLRIGSTESTDMPYELMHDPNEVVDEALVKDGTSSEKVFSLSLPIPVGIDTSMQLPRFQRRRANFWLSLKLLMMRSSTHIARHPSLMFLQLSVTVAMGVLVGVIFLQLNDEISGMQNRMGLFLFISFYFSLSSLSSLGLLDSERQLFLRERAAGTYSTGPYYIAKLCTDLLPLRVYPPLVFACIVYWMVGLRPEYLAFFRFVAVLVLVNCIASATCFAVAAGVARVDLTNLLCSLFFIFSMVFAGLLFNNNTGTTINKFTYLSFMHYSYEALNANEFLGGTYLFNPPNYRAIVISGEEVLETFGMRASRMTFDIWMLFFIFAGLSAVGYLLLRFAPANRVRQSESSIEPKPLEDS